MSSDPRLPVRTIRLVAYLTAIVAAAALTSYTLVRFGLPPV